MPATLPALTPPDAAVFSTAVERYAKLVHGVCRRVLGDAVAAEDATQETFLHLLRHLPTLRRQSAASLPAWLHQAAHGIAVDAVRKRRARREQSPVERVADETSAAAEHGTAEDLRRELDAALAELPDTQRDLLVRHFLAGVTQSDLAVERNLSQPTVSRRVDEALAALKKQLLTRGVGVASVLLLSAGLQSAAAEPVSLALIEILRGQVLTGHAVAASTSAIKAAPWSCWAKCSVAIAALLTVAAIVIISIVVTIRQRGAAALRTELAASYGQATWTPSATTPSGAVRYPSMEAWLAALPPIDAALQQRSLEFSRREPPKIPSQFLNAANLTAAQRDELAVFIAAHRAQIDEFRALVQERGLLLNAAGSLPDLLTESRREYAQRTEAMTTAVMAFNNSRVWLRVLLLSAEEDPEHAADAIDAGVQSAIHNNACLTDGLIADNLIWQRDHWYLRHALYQRLRPERIAAWLAEPSLHRKILDDAIVGEQALCVMPFAEDVLARRPIANTNELGSLLFANADLADYLQGSRNVLGALRGAGAWDLRAWNTRAEADYHVIARMMFPAYGMLTAGTVAAEASHLATREALKMAQNVRSSGALPDERQFPPLPGSGALLRYQRLSATRFRLGLDPQSPMPTYTDPETIRRRKWPTQPASEQAFSNRDNSIEIDTSLLNRDEPTTPQPADEPLTPVAPNGNS